MQRVDPRANCAKTLSAATRWHATLRRAYLSLAEKSAREYSSVQSRMHWKAWSHCR